MQIELTEDEIDDMTLAYRDTRRELEYIREKVIELLTDLVRNGDVDPNTGCINSECDPQQLTDLADRLGICL